MKYQILKKVRYLSSTYLITYSEDRLIIMSEELLQPIQTLRNLTSEIKAVAGSQNNGIIAVFCERQLVTFKPAMNGWFKSFEKN